MRLQSTRRSTSSTSRHKKASQMTLDNSVGSTTDMLETVVTPTTAVNTRGTTPQATARTSTAGTLGVPKPRSAALRGTRADKKAPENRPSAAPEPMPALANIDGLALFSEYVPWWMDQYEASAAQKRHFSSATLEKCCASLAALTSVRSLPYTDVRVCFLAFPEGHDTAWERVSRKEAAKEAHEASVVSATGSARRIFLGQLHRRNTVGLLRWLLHDVFFVPRQSVLRIESHQDHRTGRGKGCAWVTLAPDADEQLEARLLTLHHRMLFDVSREQDGVWVVQNGQSTLLQLELERRSAAEKAPAELSRRLPRGALVVERPRTPHQNPARRTRTGSSAVAVNPFAAPTPARTFSSHVSPQPQLTRFPPLDVAAESPGCGDSPRLAARSSVAESSLPTTAALSQSGAATPAPPQYLSYHYDPYACPRWAERLSSNDAMDARAFRESYMTAGEKYYLYPEEVAAAEVCVVPGMQDIRVLNQDGTRYRFNPYSVSFIEAKGDTWSSDQNPQPLTSRASQDTTFSPSDSSGRAQHPGYTNVSLTPTYPFVSDDAYTPAVGEDRLSNEDAVSSDSDDSREGTRAV